MGEIHSIDEWQGQPTRIYVWYAQEEMSDVDWENDPDIQDKLRAMRGPNNEHRLGVARYYWNPRPTGLLLVIARQAG